VSIQPSTESASTGSSRSARRTVLGLAFAAALGSIGLPAGLVLAKPKRQPKAGRRFSAGDRRNLSRSARRRPNRRPRFKVVTRTFTSPVPITIADYGAATPYPAILKVGGLRAGRIQDVNVTVSGLNHDAPYDVAIILVAPNGRTAVTLMNDVGYGAANVTLVFDDQAVSFLPAMAAIVSGTYKPTMPGAAPSPETATLKAFTGLNPNGAWRLYVADDLHGIGGSIAGWALTIKARVRVERRGPNSSRED
jgi:subtilisin-like proprotein convertase family protein